MTPEIAQFTNRGMNQDISVSKATNEFAFKNHNIRITAVNDNTLLSITNEKLPKEIGVTVYKKGLIPIKITISKVKGELQTSSVVESDISVRIKVKDVPHGIIGPAQVWYEDYTIKKNTQLVEIPIYNEMEIVSVYPESDSKYIYQYEDSQMAPAGTLYDKILGNYVGHAVVDDTLVLFTTENSKDRIYKLNYINDVFEGEILYEGSLNFSMDNPLETLPLYESNEVKKVYWVDGINPPRVININRPIQYNNDSQFDFNPNIGIIPTVKVEKTFALPGLFPSGVVQYYISYYNKFGAETGLVAASDLFYLAEYNTGESPEETVSCSFKLYLDNVDVAYDYLRVYSFIRTSYNGTPIVKIVKDIPINGNSSFVVNDYNTDGETIDPTALLFIGGSNLIANTLAYKDNTLFLGDITVKDSILEKELKDDISKGFITDADELECHSNLSYELKYLATTGDFNFQLNSSLKEISTFKKGEVYRFGIQFQKSNGNWTIPTFLGDKKCDLAPYEEDGIVWLPTARFNIPETTISLAKSLGYINYRILMAETDFSKRNVLAQGIVTPTVFNHAERVNNSGPYSIASWIMRPRNGNAQFEHMGGLGNIVYDKDGTKTYLNLTTCEIQNSLEALPFGTFNTGSDLINNYYVDSNIVNFYSPDIEGNESLFDDANLKFRIIGIAPITDSQSDIILETSTKGIRSDAGLVKSNIVKPKYSRVSASTFAYNRVPSDLPYDSDSTINDVFVRRPVYSDAAFSSEGKLPGSTDNIFTSTTSKCNYYIYLWNKEGSIIGQTADSKDADDKPFTISHAELKHKIVANKRISNNNVVLDFDKIVNYKIKPTVFNSDVIQSKVLKLSNDKSVIYQGNYETLVTSRPEGENEDFSYRVFFSDAKVTVASGYRPSGGIGTSSNIVIDRNTYTHTNLKQYSPVSIKYKTTPHLTFALNDLTDSDLLHILPSLQGEGGFDLYSLYPTEYFGEHTDHNVPWVEEGKKYFQNVIEADAGNTPYLYIGEVYREIPYKDIYGGTDEVSLQNINWIPISDITNVENSILSTGGDTYYQRWDCLSAYPFTEEDMNSVVDITSVMLETHINLDGRYDANKEISNLLNARKTNFNKLNEVYNQKNNYFTYNILDPKFDNSKYFNQVAFSLTKTNGENVDTWASINLASSFNLNGEYGKLTKLITLNDTIIALQDKALSVINFNNRTALSTESGVPIEIANSGKVDGYSVISSSVGCQNKQSVCLASSGVYFIDDYNKSMYGFNKEGLSNVSSKGMSMWFKKNLTGKEKTFYDNLTNDIYVTNVNTCLVYNEGLQSFTSFMDYNDIHALFNFNGNSIMLNKSEDSNVVIEKMFAGDYTNKYSVEYKVNPEPLVDKTFGNIEYIADCFHPLNEVDLANSLYRPNKKPFELLEVWTEYQKGILTIADNRFKYPNYEKKFRIWRVDIPRDLTNRRDRIRNPWAHIKLSKNSNEDNSKMVFHNLLVKYYK